MSESLLHRIPVVSVFADALHHFELADGWAIASHVALSMLMGLFPLLLVVASIASLWGDPGIAAYVAEAMFRTWPEPVRVPIAREVEVLLTGRRTDVLSVSLLISLILASNAVEGLRIGVSRAYRMPQSRSLVKRRLQSLLFVVVGAATLVVLAVGIVLWPLAWEISIRQMPELKLLEPTFFWIRSGLTTLVAAVALMMIHFWLPDGRRRIGDIWPGVAFTIILWMASGTLFGFYLRRFADYVSTYAGLAGVFTAIVFLYIVSVVMIFGAELNAAIIRRRQERAAAVNPG